MNRSNAHEFDSYLNVMFLHLVMFNINVARTWKAGILFFLHFDHFIVSLTPRASRLHAESPCPCCICRVHCCSSWFKVVSEARRKTKKKWNWKRTGNVRSNWWQKRKNDGKNGRSAEWLVTKKWLSSEQLESDAQACFSEPFQAKPSCGQVADAVVIVWLVSLVEPRLNQLSNDWNGEGTNKLGESQERRSVWSEHLLELFECEADAKTSKVTKAGEWWTIEVWWWREREQVDAKDAFDCVSITDATRTRTKIAFPAAWRVNDVECGMSRRKSGSRMAVSDSP